MVRAKLRVSMIETQQFGEGDNKSVFVCLDAVYDESIPEDQRFQKATPYGTAKLKIDNPAALEQFKPGQSYYVDFTPVPAP